MIKLDKDKIIFVMPKYYITNIEDFNGEASLSEDQINEVKMVMKAWKKFQRLSNNFELDEGNDQFYNLAIVMDIIKNFINNGLYVEIEEYYIHSKTDKIEFKRTIQECEPVFIDARPIYLHFITKRQKVQEQDFIRNIQSFVLEEISNEIGWLIGFSYAHTGMPIAKNKNQIINHLKRNLLDTFNTRKIHLIKLLIKYFEVNISKQIITVIIL